MIRLMLIFSLSLVGFTSHAMEFRAAKIWCVQGDGTGCNVCMGRGTDGLGGYVDPMTEAVVDGLANLENSRTETNPYECMVKYIFVDYRLKTFEIKNCR